MTRNNDAQAGGGCVLMIQLDETRIDDVGLALGPLGITFEVVESGRHLRWERTLVLRIPTERVEEAILALELKGFPHVLAYQSEGSV